MTNQAHIRNFCIIAHIDHGKSTLADRLLEYTGTVSKREMMEQTLDQMELEREKGVIGLPQEECILASAKEGIGTQDILEAIVQRVPPPKGNLHQPLRALVFDSHYDLYKGVIAYVRIVDGELRESERIAMVATGSTTEILEAGYFQPRLISSSTLSAGEVGYIATGFKNVIDCRVGDTVTTPNALATVEALPANTPAKPMVFAGIYP